MTTTEAIEQLKDAIWEEERLIRCNLEARIRQLERNVDALTKENDDLKRCVRVLPQ